MERLQRILASRGVASRRKAEELITSGRVSVDGKTVTALGVKADPILSEIRVDGKLLPSQTARYIILNKPRGYITTTKDERDRWTVMDLVDTRDRVYPVGRLDRETEGLLLLTNDGDVANRVMHPRYELDKEYHVVTSTRPSDATMQRVRNGLTIDGKKVAPAAFRIFRESREGLILTLTIHEGISHVVRKMMDAARIPIQRLRRVRIGPLSLTSLPLGAWRDLTAGERATLFEALGLESRGPDRPSEPKPEIHLTRRPYRPRRTDQPASAIRSQPERAAPLPRSTEPKEQSAERPSDVRSRRRKGEPPAPLPKRARPDRAARTGHGGAGTGPRPARPQKNPRAPRGEHDERNRSGGRRSDRSDKSSAPESDRDRRTGGGRQDDSGKPRRRAPRRDAI
jgi:pseudouridine synthase